MFFIFQYFSGAWMPAGVASVVMLVLGFVFAAVSGYLVGIIGVSNNPTSGLTVSVLIVVAFLMLALGMSGEPAVAAVLGVAAFTCTSVSVAGEMMQDLKAGTHPRLHAVEDADGRYAGRDGGVAGDVPCAVAAASRRSETCGGRGT